MIQRRGQKQTAKQWAREMVIKDLGNIFDDPQHSHGADFNGFTAEEKAEVERFLAQFEKRIIKLMGGWED